MRDIAVVVSTILDLKLPILTAPNPRAMTPFLIRWNKISLGHVRQHSHINGTR